MGPSLARSRTRLTGSLTQDDDEDDEDEDEDDDDILPVLRETWKSLTSHRLPLNTGSVRPTQGRTCAVLQVNGGSQSLMAKLDDGGLLVGYHWQSAFTFRTVWAMCEKLKSLVTKNFRFQRGQ